jgi:hypothetical protein
VYKKKRQLLKPGGTAENVAYHCTLEDVTTDITPKNHIRLLSKGMFYEKQTNESSCHIRHHSIDLKILITGEEYID